MSSWLPSPKVTPHPAWGLRDHREQRRIDAAAKAESEIQITDFVVFALLAFRAVEIAGFPVQELAVAALLGLVLLRRPTPGLALPPAVALLCAAILGLLVYSGLENGVDWVRRVGHMGLWVGLVWTLATGRISLRSAGLGLAAGLSVVGALAIVGVGPDGYEGRLTGFFGDPNAAAYFLVVLGTLAIAAVFGRARSLGIAVALGLAAVTVLTYSRTGIVAGLICLLWWALGRRLGLVPGAALTGAVAWASNQIPDDFWERFSVFADRAGSDALRERIIAREEDLLSVAPWYGNGPGTAFVSLGDQQFFFHNSYFATRQEGGWLLLLLVLALVGYAFVAVSRQSRTGNGFAIACQAGLLGTLAMAATLGEVFLELPVAVAIGFALRVAQDDPADPVATVSVSGPRRG